MASAAGGGAPVATTAVQPAEAAAAGGSPVYRFYSAGFQSHFYTIDPAERDRILAQWSRDWSYEGVAYTAYRTQVAGTVPLYRFWSDSFNGHFYTASQSERDRVRATWPDTWAIRIGPESWSVDSRPVTSLPM